MATRPASSVKIALIALVFVICGCSIYANLALAVSDKEYYRYFPPFKPNTNANANRVLGGGGEGLNIARSLVKGEGFANPFNNAQTGPTAWTAPIFPGLLAALFVVFQSDRDPAMWVLVGLQLLTLIGSGVLVLLLSRATTSRVTPFAIAVVFVGAALCDFSGWFQRNDDYWLVLLAIDLMIVGTCWWRPLNDWINAAAWGLFAGLAGLLNPVLGLCWLVLSLTLVTKQNPLSKADKRSSSPTRPTWVRLGTAFLFGALTVAPWTIRNYLVFGRLIPVKSNLGYELYQSQCLQADGVLKGFSRHPINPRGEEREEYVALGEMAYVDKKMGTFWKSVLADPIDYLDRAAFRFFAVTVWYMPLSRTSITRQPWRVWTNRVFYALPFLALVVLLFTAHSKPLSWPQKVVAGIYVLYFLPYVAISFYDRYAVPMIGVKVLLVVWAVDRLLEGLVGSNGGRPRAWKLTCR